MVWWVVISRRCSISGVVGGQVLAGEAAGVGADLWALGCLLYHAMTGQRPFHGDTDYLTFQVPQKALVLVYM